MSDDQAIEQAIQDKGLNAPRVTPERVDEVIAGVSYFKLNEVLTICVMQLVNGFTVTGESACASPENFDEDIGRAIAYRNARDKIWALEGYLLKQWLYLEAAAVAAEAAGAVDTATPFPELIRTGQPWVDGKNV